MRPTSATAPKKSESTFSSLMVVLVCVSASFRTVLVKRKRALSKKTQVSRFRHSCQDSDSLAFRYVPLWVWRPYSHLGVQRPRFVKGVYASAAPVVLARREGNGICCQDALQPVSLNRHRWPLRRCTLLVRTRKNYRESNVAMM